MIVILSSAYVNKEFIAEFGKVPPSFLPIGNVRLFEKQIESIVKTFPKEEIIITLPKTYEIPIQDKIKLNTQKIKIIKADERKSIGEALYYILEKINEKNFSKETIRILYGDTLIHKLPSEQNVLGLVDTDDEYDWEIEEIRIQTKKIWCGYFSFENYNLLINELEKSKMDFICAVKKYDRTKKLNRINIEKWYDFGHINTYFSNRTKSTTERTFNKLIISEGIVKKIGENSKIKAETNWFLQIPEEIKKFTPQLLSYGSENDKNFYKIEYLPLPPLNELFVHGRNERQFWVKIFEIIKKYIILSQKKINQKEKKIVDKNFTKLITEKTYDRLNDYFKQNKELNYQTELKLNGEKVPKIKEIVEKCIELVKLKKSIYGVMHGDLCFSNVLYDSRLAQIKIIDPRGIDLEKKEIIFGDLRYDYAKIVHSVIGLYDHIISGAYQVKVKNNNNEYHIDFRIYTENRILEIQSIFSKEFKIDELTVKDIMPVTVLLFISMLPLHYDNKERQLALFANALRLYKKYIN
jgi:hypothetical protein